MNTPETRNYNIQSKQLFSKELTPEKIDELVHAGADVNYTFSPCNNGYYSYVLKHWISEKHYNNVEKLLKIGADVNTPNGECAAIQSAICTNNANIVALVLSYKPHEIHLYYPMYLRQHGGSPHSRDDIILLLLAATKERPNNQKELNLALQHAIGASSENIPLLLEAGAEPECALQHLLSWKFRNLADHKNTAGTPSLDILQLLCNYPVSDMERVMHARDLLKNIMENAQQALKILDSCTTKLEGLQQ